MPFEFKRLEIPDVILIVPKVFRDERGFFMETFKKSDFDKAGIGGDWVQDNHAMSRRSVLRGLHYQLNPKAQGKLVRVVKGAMFDVAVDLRKGSPTYGKWVGVTLTAENQYMLWIPPGFAHGVAVLEDYTEHLYKITGNEYSPKHERAIRWNDPDIGIKWPIKNPIMSDKDQEAPYLREAEVNFTY